MITIANLDQLNYAGLAALYLIHFRLKRTDDAKLSLQALGDAVQINLNDEEELQLKFSG
jgi:hypothetical protein